eukprot:gb/GECH01014043.1/.p1 GENE.gb/GECH01014043.1/~~gb/GECH01014043.1/.p1  ORF type:complete len:302 (+),score=52.75 gb/GECH01014043.1/:1-906(+)
MWLHKLLTGTGYTLITACTGAVAVLTVYGVMAELFGAAVIGMNAAYPVLAAVVVVGHTYMTYGWMGGLWFHVVGGFMVWLFFMLGCLTVFPFGSKLSFPTIVHGYGAHSVRVPVTVSVLYPLMLYAAHIVAATVFSPRWPLNRDTRPRYLCFSVSMATGVLMALWVAVPQLINQNIGYWRWEHGGSVLGAPVWFYVSWSVFAAVLVFGVQIGACCSSPLIDRRDDSWIDDDDDNDDEDYNNKIGKFMDTLLLLTIAAIGAACMGMHEPPVVSFLGVGFVTVPCLMALTRRLMSDTGTMRRY